MCSFSVSLTHYGFFLGGMTVLSQMVEGVKFFSGPTNLPTDAIIQIRLNQTGLEETEV